METPRLETLVNELEKEVSPYKGIIENSEKQKMQSAVLFNRGTPTLSRFSLVMKYKFYVAIPIVVLGLMVGIKPKFLYNESYDKKGKPVLTFSFRRLLIFWISLSFAFIVALFIYRYKYVSEELVRQ